MYDGDGKRVKSTFNSTTTTYFVGNHYEVTGSTITKYYYAGSQRIAMRTNGTLNYLLGDHLGSTSLVTDSAGNKVNEQRYKAWGETRYTFGGEKTRYQYTGQYSYTSDFGLYFYNARWYDSSLGRFAQADTIIPLNQGVQAWDRFAYTNNNPVRYTDPTGHKYCLKDDKCDDNILTGSGKDFFRDYEGYSAWERNILRKLYDNGGQNAVHGVMYILENDVHIKVGSRTNWRSWGSTAGWFDPKSNSIELNPNAGYESGEMPDTWGLATIIHEAYHLEQGAPLTKFKELEAMQISIDVAINLGGYYGGPSGPPGQQPDPLSRDGRTLALTLSHDPQVINEYSEILYDTSFGYWLFYNLLPIDSPRPTP